MLEEGLASLGEGLSEYGVLHGVLSLRLTLGKDGAVTSTRTLANTIVGLESPGAVETAAVRRVVRTA